MEAVPRLPMINFDTKTSTEIVTFGPKLKQYIASFYHEDPESYNTEIHTLETLRAGAVRPSIDVVGCQMLKKYYCQLHFLKSRFPMEDGQACSVYFSWRDNYSNMVCSVEDVDFELMNILFDIGAVHSKLGSEDSRITPEGMKMACTHFQCAAWAFQTVRESYPQMVGLVLAPEVVHFMHLTCLAQAQECILEKSMMDNRKATIIAKVAVQVVDYFKQALNTLHSTEDGALSDLIGSKTFKDWVKYLNFKIMYHKAISLLYLGQQAEEQQKMGERVAFYQAASDTLQEASKKGSNLPNQQEINEALAFTTDVIEGKKKAAKNENEFIYHEEVPDKDALADVKGASLVKGTAFSVNDQDVSGPDIFARLIPMEAHEASSLYSEKKANLLRSLGEAVENKDKALVEFVSSLQLEGLSQMRQANGLTQDLVDRAAAMSAKPTAIKDLVNAMSTLSGIYHDVEGMLADIDSLIKEEDKKEKQYQAEMGTRPPSIIVTDLTREYTKYQEAHSKACESNQNLHKAMTNHSANLKILSLPLSELKQQIPSIEFPNQNINEEIINEMEKLLSKIDEMKKQRAMLWAQFHDAVKNDDITSRLVTNSQMSKEQLFEQELQKHHNQAALIEQNMTAQDNILKALVDVYARFTETRRFIQDVISKRNSMLAALNNSYDTYDDLLAKANKGLEFYNKLETNVSKLLQRIKSTCKVQDEEREQILAKQIKPITISSTPKLKDYLDAKAKDEGKKLPGSSLVAAPAMLPDQSWPPGVRPTPLGSEMNNDNMQGYNIEQNNYLPYNVPGNYNAYYNSGYVPANNMLPNTYSNNSDLPTTSLPSTFSNNSDPVNLNLNSSLPNAFSNNSGYSYLNYNYTNADQDLSARMGKASIDEQNYGQQNVLQNIPQNLPQNMPQNVPQNLALNVQHNRQQNIPQNVQQNLPQNVPQNVLQNRPQNVSQNMPQNIQQNIPQNLSQNVPQNMPQNAPQNVLQNVQNNVPQNIPQNVQQNMGQYMYGYMQQNSQDNSSVPQYSHPNNQYAQGSNLPTNNYVPEKSLDYTLNESLNYPSEKNVGYAPEKNVSYAPEKNISYPPDDNVSYASDNTNNVMTGQGYVDNKQNFTSASLPNTSLDYYNSPTFNYASVYAPSSQPTVNYAPQSYSPATSIQQPDYSSQYATPATNYMTPNLFMQSNIVPPGYNASNAYYQADSTPNPYEQSPSASVNNSYESQAANLNNSLYTNPPPPNSSTSPSYGNQQQNEEYYNNYQQYYAQVSVVNPFTPNNPVGVYHSYQTQPEEQLQNYSSSVSNVVQPEKYFQNYVSVAGQSIQSYTTSSIPTLSYTSTESASGSIQHPSVQTNPINSSLTQPETSNKEASNIDLLSGLDFTINQAPLVPQPKVEKVEAQPKEVAVTKSAELQSSASAPKSSKMGDPMKNVFLKKKFQKHSFQDPILIKEFVQEVDKFEKFVDTLSIKTLNGPTSLEMKWKEIQDKQDAEQSLHSISVARCYPMKNRYPDILPFDQTRVTLGGIKHDYINASHVKDISLYSPDFIVTQSPLHSTYHDFWLMVCDQQVELIICLLNEGEMEVDKYWPTQGLMTIENLAISVDKQNLHQHWTDTELIINELDDRRKRKVRHIQFKAWPSTLFSPTPVVSSFLSEILQYPNLFDNPIVIHCSAGIGRSGSLCLMLCAVTEILANPPAIPDLSKLAIKLSSARKNIIRDQEHFKYAYQVFLQFLKDMIQKHSSSKKTVIGDIDCLQAQTPPILATDEDPLNSLDPFWASRRFT